jgi:hypothetical protein
MVSSFIKIFLAGYDFSGTLILNKIWNTTYSSNAYAIQVTSSSIYITGDTIHPYGVGLTDTLLVKFDLNGNQVWNKTWREAVYDHAQGSSLAIHDNDIYIGGMTFCNSNTSQDAYVLKYMDNGSACSFQWFKAWSSSGKNDEFTTVVYSGGTIYESGSGNYRIIFAKFDTSGTLLGSSNWKPGLGIGSIFDNQGTGFALAGNFYYSGGILSDVGGYKVGVLLKLNSTFGEVWNRS